MGPVMFLLVPLAAGFGIATAAQGAQQISAAAVVAMLGSLAVLIASKAETPLCAVLAFPFLFAGLIMGVGLAHLSRQVVNLGRGGGAMKSMLFLSVPLLLFAGHRFELSALVHPRHEVVMSSIWIEASPDRVWTDLRSFDSLTVEKPILMYIGLPIPIRCTMQGNGEGSRRICYFDQGYIEETVTEWKPPSRMRLSIDRTNMPGRHWLGFEDAEYDLEQSGAGTILNRKTTIISNLYPAWYWRPLERCGVVSEHDYILRDVALRFKN
jgi:hypothetical protein